MTDRRDFLAGTAAAAAATVAAAPLVAARSARAGHAEDGAAIALVGAAADRQAGAILSAPWQPAIAPRAALAQMRRLATPFLWARSVHYHAPVLIAPMERLLAFVEASQHEDGTFSAGNRHSPPDTAFLIADMAMMVDAFGRDASAISRPMAARLAAMMRKAGPALATGGIHTPNHRWEICGALARIDRIDPHPAYRARIDDWLGERIDVDRDGIYSERSPNYASAVHNPSLLVLARLPGFAGLRDIVRRNLETTIALTEPVGGEVETILSRRQDQDQRRQTLHPYYLQYRELALADGNARFAGVARWIERHADEHIGDALGEFVDRPELARPLPPEADPFTDLSRRFADAGLVRQRRGPITASFYAGSDWYWDGKPSPFFNRVGSGLATNPTLFRMWKGAVVVEAVRLIPDFFNMGHFRPSVITLDPDGTVRLSGELRVPYYQPLPRDRRRADGAYPLTASIDHRFNSALDFDHRAATFRRLGIRIVATPEPTGYRLLFETDGETDVPMTIEITLRDGGTLTGASRRPDGSFHLVQGEARYRIGGETLVIGPGNGTDEVQAAPGDNYAWVGGQLQLPGTRLYVTGHTPFRHELRLAFA